MHKPTANPPAPTLRGAPHRLRAVRAVRVAVHSGQTVDPRSPTPQRTRMPCTEPKEWLLPVGVLWDFSGTSGRISQHERETTERAFMQVNDLRRPDIAGHGVGWSLPGHLRALRRSVVATHLTCTNAGPEGVRRHLWDFGDPGPDASCFRSERRCRPADAEGGTPASSSLWAPARHNRHGPGGRSRSSKDDRRGREPRSGRGPLGLFGE